ncbi:MAG: zinc ABC transporter substrate-binding protein [Pseudohongiellaceae bacterium]|nr:zinc ABC transporter substrate-binding protein [Pseudohongiellaceae bacterium]
MASWNVLANAEIKVLATIKPLQMVAAALLEGVNEPQLLIPSRQSPHFFSLRPSDARGLAEADLILWIGPQMETFLVQAIEQASANAHVIQASTLEGVVLFDLEGDEDSHEDHSEHEHAVDPHLWLDVHNIRLLANELFEQLSVLDVANSQRYQQNLNTFLVGLQGIERQMQVEGERFQQLPYAVYHNGIQYLERQLGIEHAFVVVPNHEVQPGIRHLLELRESLETQELHCLLVDPTANPATIKTVFGERDVREGRLDPLGDDIALSANSYVELMSTLIADAGRCLLP